MSTPNEAKATLHLWFSRLCRAEVDAIVSPYDYPPRGPLEPQEVEQVEYLVALSDKAHTNALKLLGIKKSRKKAQRAWQDAMARLGGQEP